MFVGLFLATLLSFTYSTHVFAVLSCTFLRSVPTFYIMLSLSFPLSPSPRLSKFLDRGNEMCIFLLLHSVATGGKKVYLIVFLQDFWYCAHHKQGK